MHVGRARAQDAAARQGDLGPAEAAQQWSDQIERRGELADQGIGRPYVADVGGIDGQRARAVLVQPRAEGFQERAHDRDVRDARDAVQRHRRASQERRGHNRQRRVLRAVGFDAAFEPVAASDAQRRIQSIQDVHAALFETGPALSVRLCALKPSASAIKQKNAEIAPVQGGP